MWFAFFIAALVASTPIAHAFCPSPRIDTDVVKRAIKYEAVKRNSLIARNNINVDIYLHNVARGATWDEGYVSVSLIMSFLGLNSLLITTKEELLQKQFDIIHEAFLPYGIKMSLAGLDHTINSAWSNITIDSQSEADMKNALHKGDYTDINIYVVDELYYPNRINDTLTHIDLGNDLGFELYEIMGYTSPPVPLIEFYSDFVADAAIISHKAVYGSNRTDRDLGRVAIHEIGHWFGLGHTFQWGCVGLGDDIADTPLEDISQLETSGGCPEGRDTCPGSPGLDPIHNHMDYTSE
jgi:hypothetical protein